ncbi:MULTISPECIES: radical SAM family heme chaperone HemW [Sporosarcina]|uniref:radical SAM family heme chaperone HemW n=1 Tax=Sporosarcina TaxID=1569 RepID=UPI00078BAA25|nr:MULTISPECIES: radical SAM family heme chaperone HemW [Sporosarcina]AMQ06075.1 coproporphyrinogen III oxidase [Sporosarcina psychrophila]QNK90041.1 oxygen-independent coproporphyrinogen III oxidase [Sporosarcina sp. resist]
MRGMYIHIPFCHQICHYCDFNKVFFKNQPVDEYIESMGQELAIMRQEGISFKEVETVFLGGGTPTSLSEKQLERLLEIIHEYVDVSSLKEFSTEANPDELTFGKLIVLKNGGVDRLSIGVQSFDADLLTKIGRTHGPDDAARVVGEARKAGFDNISIDLIYGLPGQTIAQWQDTLDKALALDLPHYSGYSLIVEPKTVFYNLMNKGKLPLPGEDMETEMFTMLIEQMERKGRKRYEISNFAIPGHESIHNLIYWENATYAGVGAGAHGYVDGTRYSNIGPIAKYMEKTALGERPVQQTHVVTAIEAMEEEMFLGLRKSNGVSISLFQEKFGRSLEEVYGETLHSLIKDGLVERLDDAVKLTHRGVYRGNDVFQQFLK